MVDVTEPGYDKKLILSDSEDGRGKGIIIWALIGNETKPWLMSRVDTSGVSEIL